MAPPEEDERMWGWKQEKWERERGRARPTLGVRLLSLFSRRTGMEEKGWPHYDARASKCIAKDYRTGIGSGNDVKLSRQLSCYHG